MTRNDGLTTGMTCMTGITRDDSDDGDTDRYGPVSYWLVNFFPVPSNSSRSLCEI